MGVTNTGSKEFLGILAENADSHSCYQKLCFNGSRIGHKMINKI
jgi:hypothetical protein